MAKTKTSSADLWRERHRELKKLGLETGRLKKGYTPAEKQRFYRATKTLGKLAEMAVTPKKFSGNVPYKATGLKLKNRKEIKAAKEAGYTVYKDRLVLSHSVISVPSLRRNVKVAGTDFKSPLAIVTKPDSGVGVTKMRYVADPVTYLYWLEHYRHEKVPKGAALFVNIGNNESFNQSFTDAKKLIDYITNWAPKDDPNNKNLKNELIKQMYVTLY